MSFNPAEFVIRSIKNSHFQKPVSTMHINLERNLIATAGDKVIFVWEYDSFKLAGVCMCNNEITKISSKFIDDHLLLYAFDGNVSVFDVNCECPFSVF